MLPCADAQAARPSWPTTGRKATASAAVCALGLVRARVRLRVRARARARARTRARARMRARARARVAGWPLLLTLTLALTVPRVRRKRATPAALRGLRWLDIPSPTAAVPPASPSEARDAREQLREGDQVEGAYVGQSPAA